MKYLKYTYPRQALVVCGRLTRGGTGADVLMLEVYMHTSPPCYLLGVSADSREGRLHHVRITTLPRAPPNKRQEGSVRGVGVPRTLSSENVLRCPGTLDAHDPSGSHQKW